MYQSFSAYLFDIKFNYVILSSFHKAYLRGDENEDDFLEVKNRVLFNAHRCYRRISPRRFEKHRVKYYEMVKTLYDRGALTKPEYEVEKWYMDFCKTSKRNFHKLKFDRE